MISATAAAADGKTFDDMKRPVAKFDFRKTVWIILQEIEQVTMEINLGIL